MLYKLSIILIYSLGAFFTALILYPPYIVFLRKIKGGQSIREDSVTGDKASIYKELHKHKSGTPTMGGGVMLLVVGLMVVFSLAVQKAGFTTNSLLSRQETYMPLFAFFSMGILGMIDDILNIRGKTAIKGLTAKIKFIWMFLFSGFIVYRFTIKLGIHHINIWPFGGEIDFGIRYGIITFFTTVIIVNAINITDGLDGLVGGLMLIVLSVLAIITFISNWFLATTIIGIILGCMLAFLRFNINPAKIFMGDAGSLALGGIISALIYLININFGIAVPFFILMSIFWLEFGSSLFQIFWKKVFKKKLFTIAPFHHLLERQGMAEHTIVMKFRVMQGLLAAIALIAILYQL